MFNIQIASDLHIDHNNENLNIDCNEYLQFPSGNNNVNILILPGDIGCLYKLRQLENFLVELSSKYDYIFYVYGNNEFYYYNQDLKKTYEELLEQGKSLLKIPNLYVLNNKSLIIGDYIFVGCTLWSKLYFKDYFPSYLKIHGFTKEKYNNLFNKDLEYIKQSIYYSKIYKKKMVIITHYPPISFKKNISSMCDNFYNNNLYDLIYANPNILYWIHGHNHKSIVSKINSTLVISNQKGKYGDKHKRYNKNFIIKIN
jgi:predicted phosphohydrolase